MYKVHCDTKYSKNDKKKFEWKKSFFDKITGLSAFSLEFFSFFLSRIHQKPISTMIR